MIMIFNSFFDYGFIRKSSLFEGKSNFTDEWEDGDASK